MKQLCEIEKNFTAVPNEILLDKHLTEKEKILYLYLLSKQTKKNAQKNCVSVCSGNWIFYNKKICEDLKIDYKTMKDRLKSLEAKKYIHCDYTDSKSRFGVPEGFKVTLFFQNNEYTRTGKFKDQRENLKDEDIKIFYRQNMARCGINKKTILYPTSKQWNAIFEIMGKYKYLIPYIPYYFRYCLDHYEAELDFITFSHLFGEAFDSFNHLISFLVRQKKICEIEMKYERAIFNNKDNEEIKGYLNEMKKEDLERFERLPPVSYEGEQSEENYIDLLEEEYDEYI